MFCVRCGKEIADDAVVCIGCGRPVTPLAEVGKKWGTGAMVALVIGTLVIPLVGIVFGIVGLNKPEKKAQGKVLLTIGIVMMVIGIIVMAAD